jgi:hypothetical protein
LFTIGACRKDERRRQAGERTWTAGATRRYFLKHLVMEASMQKPTRTVAQAIPVHFLRMALAALVAAAAVGLAAPSRAGQPPAGQDGHTAGRQAG